jgi:integrase
MSRRSKGEGSIYQRKDGLWVAAIALGNRRKVVYGKSRRDVATKLAILQNSTAAGRLVASSRITVEQFMLDWLQAVEPNLRISTYSNYSDIVRLHVNPALGHLRLQHLQPIHLVHLYADRQRQGLSSARVHALHRLLRKSLGDAVHWQILPSNPATSAHAPRLDTSPRYVWYEEETIRFLKYAQSQRHVWNNLWQFLLGSGARIGEALGLTWDHVDLGKGAVHIVQAIAIVRNRPILGKPKTAAGCRSIKLPPFALEALRAQRERPGTQEYCFRTRNSTVPNPENLRQSLLAACRGAEVPDLRVHYLRHVHATHALRLGADIKSLQSRLGHSTPNLLLRLYAHNLESGDGQVAESWQLLATG